MRLLLVLILTTAAQALPANWVSREEWGALDTPMPTEFRQVPRAIAVHHAGVLWKAGDRPVPKVRELQRWSRDSKHWPDLPYHFVVAPHGEILEGRNPWFRADSNTDYNLQGVLTVEVLGNFEEQRVCLTQLQALSALIRDLRSCYSIDSIKTHRQYAPGQTVCPGRDLARYVETGILNSWLDGAVPALLPPLSEGPIEFISED